MAYDGVALAKLIGERMRPLHIMAVRDCHSTNDIVHEFFEGPASPEAVLAVADFQRSGQGRQGRSWYSPEGKDVLMTLGLKRDRFALPQDPRLPLAVCVLVARGIERATGVQPRPKWPNDLMDPEGRKLCGILLRNRATHFAVGVGVNVNSRPEEFPEEIQPRVSTLYALTGKSHDRSAIVAAVARELLDFFESCLAESLADLVNQWLQHTVTFSHSLKLRSETGLHEVTPMRLIAETGELVVRHQEGREETLSSAKLIEP